MKVNNIDVIVQRKNIKHMYLRITPDATIKISAPYSVSDNDIINFINSKMDWINEKRNLILNNYSPPVKYITGEPHYLWGEKYCLQLITNEKIKNAFKKDNIIYLPVSKKSKIANREKILNNFYKQELIHELSKIYEKCTLKVGRKPADIKIRKMKNWGNCKQNQIITLNSNLAKKPKMCLEYVFIHELCHLIEFNHGKNFKMLMDKNCPNWREIKKILNA